jgi:hypothetical protein
VSGADDEFEIPLRRPYAPLGLMIALITPLGLWLLLHERRPHPGLLPLSRFLEANPVLLYGVALALLAAAAWLSLALVGVARHPRWSLRATDGGLHLPHSRLPLASSALEVVPWREILLIHLNGSFSLIIETRARKWIIPAYWLSTREQAQRARQALEERLRREQQKIGAAKAR